MFNTAYQDYRCPNCRSLIRLQGDLEFSAPAGQKLNCPVCNQEWLIASSQGILPYLWKVDRVIERVEPTHSPVIVDNIVPAELQQSIWKDFSILQPLQNLGSGLKTIGIFVIIILALLFLNQWIFKKRG